MLAADVPRRQYDHASDGGSPDPLVGPRSCRAPNEKIRGQHTGVGDWFNTPLGHMGVQVPRDTTVSFGGSGQAGLRVSSSYVSIRTNGGQAAITCEPVGSATAMLAAKLAWLPAASLLAAADQAAHNPDHLHAGHAGVHPYPVIVTGVLASTSLS
jgi:hypothetical protein